MGQSVLGPHPGGKMLKHKIRKSRKNILSLLEAVTQEEAEKGETKETGTSIEKEKTDEGYYTATEKEKTKSKGKRRAVPEDAKENGKRSNEKRGNGEKTEKPSGPIRGAETPYILPVMVALPCRRSTPLEDYVATMAGVGNLLQQQGELINKMGELLKEKQGEEAKPDQKKEEKGESASSSSIQTLRRILEVEELMRFSMAIDQKLQGIEQHLESSNKPNSIK